MKKTIPPKALAALSTLVPISAWAEPVRVEPLALMVGGGASFGLGVLFGLWLCRMWCAKRDRQDPKDRLTR